MMRRFALLLLLAALAPARPPEAPVFVQVVEFPYRQFPRHLWERELTWLRNIGIDTVSCEISGKAPASDPRADPDGLLRILRSLGMRAWVRGSMAAAYEMHLARHGGPIVYTDAQPPPAPVTRLSAVDPAALARSRVALAHGTGTLLWTDVEDRLAPGLRRGAVSLDGEERDGAAVLRRNTELLRGWARTLPEMRQRRSVRVTRSKASAGITAQQIHTAARAGAAALLVRNADGEPRRAALRAFDPATRQRLQLTLDVPPRESLWLPVNVSLARSGLCDDCGVFAPEERIVYATAELRRIEYENGVLAFEFTAPSAGELLLKLARKPSGPLLAAGSPTEFDWDATALQARLPIPQGKGPAHRVRVGLAIEPPDHSAFFSGLRRLISGKSNIVSTTYSSADLAARSRLLAPARYGVKRLPKSDLEVDYEIAVPADAMHGEFVTLALEADGVRLGRERIQVLQPASVFFREAVALHLGRDTKLSLTPAYVPIEAAGGRTLTLVVRNNDPAIQTFQVEFEGESLSFSPQKLELAAGGMMEREGRVRVFAGGAGLHTARIRVSGAASLEREVKFLPLRRGAAAFARLDADGDGVEDWILENQRVRAVFSGADGRWMELVWKDSDANLLPDSGLLPIDGPVEASLDGSAAVLTFAAGRTVRLDGADPVVRITQSKPLALEGLSGGDYGAARLTVERPSPNAAELRLAAIQQP
ncbi:MAG: hypothetical protein IPM24_07100 [Bryobacterales bacterium]|nr:hypothetical protein [Bryobacterales bacterium]